MLRFWGLTFELSGRRRQATRRARCNMDKGAAPAWWPAVGAPLERGVRPQRAALRERTGTSAIAYQSPIDSAMRHLVNDTLAFSCVSL